MFKPFTLFVVVFFIPAAFANHEGTPPAFGDYVFSDFKASQIEVTIDTLNQSLNVKAKIAFVLDQPGKPLFDFLHRVSRYSVSLNETILEEDGDFQTVESPGAAD